MYGYGTNYREVKHWSKHRFRWRTSIALGNDDWSLQTQTIIFVSFIENLAMETKLTSSKQLLLSNMWVLDITIHITHIPTINCDIRILINSEFWVVDITNDLLPSYNFARQICLDTPETRSTVWPVVNLVLRNWDCIILRSYRLV